jgi:hypothetical protein
MRIYAAGIAVLLGLPPLRVKVKAETWAESVDSGIMV